MGSGEVVKVLPFGEFLREIDVVCASQELVELLLVGAVRPFDFAVQLGRSWFDVGVADATVFDVPVELGLELVPAVGSDRLYSEGETSR